MTLSQHLIEEIRELPAKYPQPRSAVMPALDLAQEELGYLTPEAMTEVADALMLDPGYVEGVATFYTLFHHEPIGKHRFYMCTNLACMLRGSDEVVTRLKEAIGVSEPGEVSKDGMFSYEEVECLGACEYAPMCRIDHRYEYDLTVVKIDQIVNDCRLPRLYQKNASAQKTGAAQKTASAQRTASADAPRPKPAARRAPRAKKADGGA